MGQMERMSEAVQAYPDLSRHFVDAQTLAWKPHGVDALCNRISELAQVDIEEKQHEIDIARELPEYERLRRTRGLANLVAMWSPRQRRRSLQCIRRADGSNAIDEQECCSLLSGHWGNVFSDKPVDTRKCREFLSSWSRRLPSVNWMLTFEQFEGVLSNTNDSSLGPDGVPYSAWRHAPQSARKVLYSAYVSWIRTGQLPQNFNYSFLVLLPEGEHEDDHINVSRFPAKTRPLSLSNTDGKIFADCLRAAIHGHMAAWASPQQRGFISGRPMLSNFMDVESKAIELSAVLGRNGAIVLCDFAAAFPSISHVYLWLAMEYVGIPAFIIQAVKSLYANDRHWFRFGSVCVEAFAITSGVKQGCPLSPLLYMIVTDAFMRALAQSIGPQDMVRGYAVDIAMVLSSFWRTCPSLSVLFEEFASLSLCGFSRQAPAFSVYYGRQRQNGRTSLLPTRANTWAFGLVQALWANVRQPP